jgi:hypothetical protein
LQTYAPAHICKPVAEDHPAGTSINDINWPPKDRFNAGFDFSYSRFLGNLSVSCTDEAYWQDVLDARLAGTTDSFTTVTLDSECDGPTTA